MKTRDFFFDLPDELIAQFPAERREQSRLMVLGRTSGIIQHRMTSDLPDLLPEGSVFVLNNSKVRKARILATRDGGGTRELLFLSRVSAGPTAEGETWQVMTRRPSRLRLGSTVQLPGGIHAEIVAHGSQTVDLRVPEPLEETFFETYGHVPLPPYIRRDDEPADEQRYQTVYASAPGSVAAPTAGLHLTDSLLAKTAARGIRILQLTLHVGPGTFLPVRTENIENHVMHSEDYDVGPDVAHEINTALRAGLPIIAVGTTSVRTLESAYAVEQGAIVPGPGSTNLFIRPGFRFNVVSQLLTNFHTPQSTLLMLVCAFASRERVLTAYREAVKQTYRFFSYGDGMLIQ